MPGIYEIQRSDTRTVIKTKVSNHFQSNLLERLNEHINENKKLKLYASFKSLYRFEPYLDYLQNFTVRSKTNGQCS